MVNTRRPRFREGDKPVDKLNGWFDRWRGPIAALASLFSVAAIIFSALVVFRADLGWSSSSAPGARLAKVEARVDTLMQDVKEIRGQARPLLINLCFEASDTVLALIQQDISCAKLLPQRPPR